MGVIMACYAEVASQFSEAGGPYCMRARPSGGWRGSWWAGCSIWRRRQLRRRMRICLSFILRILAGAKEPWPRFVILTLLVGLLALINARARVRERR